MTFYPGQKVVCIDNQAREGFLWNPAADVPEVNQVYTIRNYIPWGKGSDGMQSLVILSEIRNHCTQSDFPASFNANRFRPVVETKTNISIFNKLLKTNKREMV